MKRKLCCVFLASGLIACADRTVETERVVVERNQQAPAREVVVERRTLPTIDGYRTEERVVEERVVPRSTVRRTETVTTRERD